MRHEYDLFERFPDGSSLWRASAKGLESARHHLAGLSEHSPNQFYAINVVSGKVVWSGIQPARFDVSTRIGRSGGAAAA